MHMKVQGCLRQAHFIEIHQVFIKKTGLTDLHMAGPITSEIKVLNSVIRYNCNYQTEQRTNLTPMHMNSLCTKDVVSPAW